AGRRRPRPRHHAAPVPRAALGPREGPRGVNREGLHHVGNSTHWIVLEGVRILTDPWVTEPADRILEHTHEPRPLPTGPDVVLITHRHGDHFDLPALATVDRTAAVVVAA